MLTFIVSKNLKKTLGSSHFFGRVSENKKIFFATVFSIISLFPFSNGLLLANGDKKWEDNTSAEQKQYSTFVITSLKVTKEGFLNWTTVSEKNPLPYIIEQYVYNKWVTIGSMDGIGTPNANSYSFQVLLHSGENRFRIKQKNADNTFRYSNEIITVSRKSEADIKVKKFKRSISFSRETYFQLYDPFGKLIQSGIGGGLNFRKMPKGQYCIIYDNKMYTFIK